MILISTLRDPPYDHCGVVIRHVGSGPPTTYSLPHCTMLGGDILTTDVQGNSNPPYTIRSIRLSENWLREWVIQALNPPITSQDWLDFPDPRDTKKLGKVITDAWIRNGGLCCYSHKSSRLVMVSAAESPDTPEIREKKRQLHDELSRWIKTTDTTWSVFPSSAPPKHVDCLLQLYRLGEYDIRRWDDPEIDRNLSEL